MLDVVAQVSLLFIMAEKNAYADVIGAYLWKTKDFGFKKNEVLVIRTDKTEIIERARLPNRFAEMYTLVGGYVATRCFGKEVNLNDEAVRTHLSRLELQEGIAKRLARTITDLTMPGDVLRFASLDATEQGDSGAQFRVDYLKPSGAIGFYHSNWVVVQQTPDDEMKRIVETKDRVWEGTAAKDEAIRNWCDQVSRATGRTWRYARIDQ